MTTLLTSITISVALFIGIIVFFVMIIAFLLWVLRVVFKRDANLYTQQQMIDFAQSHSNNEVVIYDLNQWESHEGRKVRFSDN